MRVDHDVHICTPHAHKHTHTPYAHIIYRSSHPKPNSNELYADINDVKLTQNGSLATGEMYTSMGQLDEGNTYTTTKLDQDMYM